jgi:hypothetical protein
VTPDDRHTGRHTAILEARQRGLEFARERRKRENLRKGQRRLMSVDISSPFPVKGLTRSRLSEHLAIRRCFGFIVDELDEGVVAVDVRLRWPERIPAVAVWSGTWGSIGPSSELPLITIVFAARLMSVPALLAKSGLASV